MKTIPDNYVDSVVTDPPYGISFMGHKWDYDVPSVDIWKECLRILKPGGHLLSFGGTRTYHRVVVNIEDAGFEIRDMVAWVYGQGFPKSLNVGKTMDKYLKTGNASWNGTGDSSNGNLGYTKLQFEQGYRPDDYSDRHQSKKEITEEEAKQWDGWGTALKPVIEPICLARKPLEGNVVKNVLKYGTGAININGCRVPTNEAIPINKLEQWSGFGQKERPAYVPTVNNDGRWPANLIHDGSEEVTGLFPTSKGFSGGGVNGAGFRTIYVNGENQNKQIPANYFNDNGSASRFFYYVKANKRDRNEGCEDLPLSERRTHGEQNPDLSGSSYNTTGQHPAKGRNNHPTVKPTALMQYLCKLVTQPNGIILDPFMGSGSTGKGALLEGFRFIGIEMDEGYFNIAQKRLEFISKKIKESQ